MLRAQQLIPVSVTGQAPQQFLGNVIMQPFLQQESTQGGMEHPNLGNLNLPQMLPQQMQPGELNTPTQMQHQVQQVPPAFATMPGGHQA